MEAHLTYSFKDKAHRWTDRMILTRNTGTWVIYDIGYASGRTLLKTIQKELRSAENPQ